MILLTGASGTVGTATLAALRARGARFKVAARAPEKMRASGLDTVAFDWDEPGRYSTALAGVETLFVLTPLNERALDYTRGLVDAAKDADVRHIVKLSMIGADSKPAPSLGRLHRDAEKAIVDSGIAWTMLRPTFYMQNFLNYYGVDPSQDGAVRNPHGDGRASWVDVRDVGEVAATVLLARGHEGKSYDLTGPEALSNEEAVAVLSKALGHRYTYTSVSEQAARQTMTKAGMPDWLVTTTLELGALIRDGHAATVALGVKEVLGREPRSFASWAEDLAAGRA